MPPDDLYERMLKWEAEQAKLKAEKAKKRSRARRPAGRDVSGRLKDENLRLAVIDALVEAGTLDLDLDAFEAADDEAPDAKIRKKLLATKLDEAALATLGSLSWEGGHDIQHAIWPQWDGEDAFFDIRALDGIELLTSCREVSFLACVEVSDLRPLLGMKALKTLSLPPTKRSKRAAAVLATLAERGVRVR